MAVKKPNKKADAALGRPKVNKASNPGKASSQHTKSKEPGDGAGIESNAKHGDEDLRKDIQALVQSLNLPGAVPEVVTKDSISIAKRGTKKKPGHDTTIQTSSKKRSSSKTKPSASSHPERSKSQGREKKAVPGPEAAVQNPPSSRKGYKFLINPSPEWYSAVPPLPERASLPDPSPEFIESTMARASSCLEAEASAAQANPGEATSAVGSSDAAFLSKILTSGTLSDRLSALTLMTQASPLHNQKALETLRTMAGKKVREESLKALRAIVDWWIGGGSPDRKLRYLRDQPLTHPSVTDQHLLVWAFEDWLKKYFFSVLQLLETLSLDLLLYVRMQTLTLIFTLLKSKPEQEHNLLRLLANKLGDSEKTVSSKASYFLLQLLQHHPSMKTVIIREVSSLLLRPTTSAPGGSGPANLHVRYYGVLTFNQITLAPTDKEVAELLITLYFELFKSILGQVPVKETPKLEKDKIDQELPERGSKRRRNRKADKKDNQPTKNDTIGEAGFVEVEDSDSKMISAILTGINRALPFAKMEDSIFDDYIETLFRITHSATFNVSIQALVLIFQVSTSRKSITDRFFRTLYDSLVDPRLCDSSKQPMYLNLLFKATKADVNEERVCSFVKRLLQVLGLHQPGFICGALYLLGELFATKPNLGSMIIDVKNPIENLQPGETPSTYDARKRDPQHANAGKVGLWELVPLLYHFHPSVSLHAHQLLDSEPITTSADLSLHTVSQFLDRFVYKNPKRPTPRGASSMQPNAASTLDSPLVASSARKDVGEAVNDSSFWKKNAKEVPVDQLFFHKFFLKKLSDENSRNVKRSGRKKVVEEGEEGGDGEGSNADDDDVAEADIWKAMKSSMPKVNGDVDLSDDDLPSDLDSVGSDSDGPGLDDGVDDSDSDSGSPTSGDESKGSGDDFRFSEDEGDLIDLGELLSQESDAPSDADGDWAGVTDGRKKRKKSGRDATERGGKRRKVALPTFAAYEDYAKMIDEAPEDNI